MLSDSKRVSSFCVPVSWAKWKKVDDCKLPHLTRNAANRTLTLTQKGQIWKQQLQLDVSCPWNCARRTSHGWNLELPLYCWHNAQPLHQHLPGHHLWRQPSCQVLSQAKEKSRLRRQDFCLLFAPHLQHGDDCETHRQLGYWLLCWRQLCWPSWTQLGSFSDFREVPNWLHCHPRRMSHVVEVSPPKWVLLVHHQGRTQPSALPCVRFCPFAPPCSQKLSLVQTLTLLHVNVRVVSSLRSKTTKVSSS